MLLIGKTLPNDMDKQRVEYDSIYFDISKLAII